MSEDDKLPPPSQHENQDRPGIHDARGERKAGGTYAQESYSPAARRSLLRTDQLAADRSMPESSDKEVGERDRGRQSVEEAQEEAKARR